MQNLNAGDALRIRQTKTKKVRSVPLNGKVIDDIQAWLENHPASQIDPECYLFMSQRGAVLSVPSVTGMVKTWVRNAKRQVQTDRLDIDLRGNYGRARVQVVTWGYWNPLSRSLSSVHRSRF